jgi:hypothetical protein
MEVCSVGATKSPKDEKERSHEPMRRHNGSFVSAFFNLCQLDSATDSQILRFSALFYKNRFGKNHSKLI